MNDEFIPSGDQDIKRGRGRPPKVHTEASASPQPSQRAEATRRERRRRQSDGGALQGQKLHVPAHLLRNDMEYRWLNDTANGRVQSKTVYDDWDVVQEQVTGGQGEEAPVRRIVGTHKNGEPMYAVLCAKPKEFYEEDKKTEQDRLDARDQQLRRAAPSGAATEGLDEKHAYLPNGSNTISV